MQLYAQGFRTLNMHEQAAWMPVSAISELTEKEKTCGSSEGEEWGWQWPAQLCHILNLLKAQFLMCEMKL